jgi:hypothetical protein
MGYNSLWIYKQNILLSALKMEAIYSSETLVGLSTYKSTRRYNQEVQHQYIFIDLHFQTQKFQPKLQDGTWYLNSSFVH